MMTTATFLRANRLLMLIERTARKHGLLLLSYRYSARRSETLIEREARLRRSLLELIDAESRRVAA